MTTAIIVPNPILPCSPILLANIFDPLLWANNDVVIVKTKTKNRSDIFIAF